MIFRTKKCNSKKGKVLFIDASQLYQKGRAQNSLLPEHAQSVINLYDNFADVEGQSRIVDIEEISLNEYNLNISLYVKKSTDQTKFDFKATSEELNRLYSEFIELEERTLSLLKERKLL